MKKILMVVNIIPAEIKLANNEVASNFGGWVDSNIEILKSMDIELGVVYPNNKHSIFKKINNVTYYPLKPNILPLVFGFIKDKEVDLIIDSFKPDYLYLEGSELSNNYRFIGKNIEYIFSMQGIVEKVYQNYFGGLSFRSMIKMSGYSAIMQWLGMIYVKYVILRPKIKFEKKILLNAKYYIGRTSWDQSHVPINKIENYFKIERPLRSNFYEKRWQIDNCCRHRILMGNGKIPYKGLHDLVNAVSILIKRYPEIKVYVLASQKAIDYKKNLKYTEFIKNMINRRGLENNFVLLKEINGIELEALMLTCHLAVIPSYIENSPNTLAEAMLIGLPSVVSNVGGVSSMTTHKISSFIYNPGDINAMVSYIQEIFENDSTTLKLSQNAAIIAKKAHDRLEIKRKFIHLFETILVK
jgi:glycosyltransferase involved in cell wall biosynthesis